MPPFFGGGPNPWLAMFRRRGRARRGDVRLAILVALGEAPKNGYQIMQELEQRSRGLWRPSPGSVYPALQQLEDEGLVRVDTAGGGRVFHLTDAGRAALDARAGEPSPWDALAGGDDRGELMLGMRQLMAAAAQVAHHGTPAQLSAAHRAVADARRAIYRILADEGPVDDEDDADEDGDE